MRSTYTYLENFFQPSFESSLTTAITADTLNLFANYFNWYSDAYNPLTKEITIDVLYFFLALYQQNTSSVSNVTYAVGRALRYTQYFSASTASLFARGTELLLNVKQTGMEGVIKSALSFAGSRLGYFSHTKAIELNGKIALCMANHKRH